MKLTIDQSIQNIPYYPKAALYGADSGWVRLSSNENPYPPSPQVINSIINAVFDINRYPESESELKKLIAVKYRVAPENILIGNGSNEIIETAMKAMTLPGRNKVVVADPSFAFYRIAASIYGYETIAAPQAMKTDLKAIARLIDERTRVVFLCNPNNPTGTIFTDAEFKSFLQSINPEVLVVVDEAYAEFSENKKFPRSVSYIDDYSVLVMRTFSKAYGIAGLRVGYGLGNSTLVSFLERTKQPFSVNMIALIAAKAALGDEQHQKKILGNILAEKKYLYDSLKVMNLDYIPTEANFILIRIGDQAENIAKRLFEKKILIRWLGGYGLSDCIRVTIGTSRENKMFIDALKRMID
jgi:histidinol-phosphate aminotransferase